MKHCRYERSIAGRTYVIEVTLVSTGRWRAQIARLPGMPTSLMPFYGATSDEAAHALTKWLSMVSTPAPLQSPAPAGLAVPPASLDRRARGGLR